MSLWATRRRNQALLLAGVFFILYCTRSAVHSSPSPRSMLSSLSKGVGSSSEPEGWSDFHRKLSNIRPHERDSVQIPLEGSNDPPSGTPMHPPHPQLGVADHIFVISPSHNAARREMISMLSRALSFSFSYLNSTTLLSPTDKTIIEQILDRIRWQRPRIDEREPREEEIPMPVEEKGKNAVKNAFPFAWSDEARAISILTADPSKQAVLTSLLSKPLGLSGADYWSILPSDGGEEYATWQRQHALPHWQFSAMMQTTKIPLASRENNIVRNVFITSDQIANWHSHVRAWREAVEKGYQTTIIFEDTVDLEWDIESQLGHIWPALPPTWDIVYLGHCASSSEHKSDPLPSSFRLRPTVHTLCTHAYALSQRGASKLIRFLRSPDYAYTRTIDQALKDLVQMKKIESYSVVPVLAVATTAEMRDLERVSVREIGTIQSGGKGGKGEARGVKGLVVEGLREKIKKVEETELVDSTLERVAILRAERRPGGFAAEVEIEAQWEEYEPY